MDNAIAWQDFESLRHNVKLNTVDRLKQILTGFNEECGANFTKSGKKQDLIDRITREMDHWRTTNNADKWAKGRNILNQVRTMGTYTPARMSSEHYPGPPAQYQYPPTTGPVSYGSAAAGSSSALPRYDPYAPPRRAAPSATSTPAPTPNIRFQPSPFFKVDRLVSGIVECPESTGSLDRRQQTLTFTITNDILNKLNSTSQKYQLRLYCTSSSYYSSTSAPFRPSTNPCPIEFPPTCEVRVNSVPLTANLKGMKKKPGTAPPPDLGKNLRLSNGATNRVEMVYVNSQQPVLSKKFYLVVMLVETTSVEQLIDRLKRAKYKTCQEILSKMQQAASADDDIIAGHQKMSLKCPLSYMRIATPCRSAHCVHPQCFDAYSWFSLMEQTTTWLCPVCEKVLSVEDLIVDGYFDDILKNTSEDVEDIIVEADGQWHSEDNKFASAEWKAAHPPAEAAAPTTAPVVKKQRSDSPVDAKDVNVPDKPRPITAEIVILDSDDEDEGRVKRELSPSNDGSTAGPSFRSPTKRIVEPDVIDLTLDSDDEEPVRTVAKKRKTTEDELPSPTESIWKKSRPETPVVSAAGTSSAYMNGTRYNNHSVPLSRSHTNGTSAAPPSRYGTYGTTFNGFSSFSELPPPPPPPRHPPLPPPANPYSSRPGGASPPFSDQWRQ
ncbi:hypothetical protein WOLCODRAFT_135275 [Wolfiporia cocos MD-104 SS10]|uniref:PINIT domain-containing protein n=1 Tax=Wolfiporia cocos (strain MD-104) TaxID=742152 RepID=A0A2H3J1N8_WOLCO|nr:hypothetical protein WOLCODRAFT_135275 [Wolfiporia cocos MD-104 SS10]